MTIDFNGIAAVIGALGVAIPILVNTVFSVINFMDTRKDRETRARAERKVDAIASHLNVPPGDCQ